jgi:hypothetical protein
MSKYKHKFGAYCQKCGVVCYESDSPIPIDTVRCFACKGELINRETVTKEKP